MRQITLYNFYLVDNMWKKHKIKAYSIDTITKSGQITITVESYFTNSSLYKSGGLLVPYFTSSVSEAVESLPEYTQDDS